MIILQTMNKSEISNDFNFDYELDITQNRKDKTDQYFSKEGFAFEDFMNIGDKTMKSDKLSSKYYANTSEILKKEQDSFVNPNIIDCLTEHSIKPRKKDASVLENLSLHTPPENILYATSPKFADEMFTTKTIQEISKKQFTLRRTETAADRTHPPEYLNQNSSKVIKPVQNPFKKKDPIPVNNQKEEVYKQLENQIRYYEDSLEKMIYESERMEEQIENLMANFNSASYEIELETYSKEIKTVNNKIEEERNLEVQLSKMIEQFEDQYEALVNSIKASNFSRPVKMKDEAKAIVDEINGLKAEFQALERDDGSLNLSSTLLQNYSTNQPGNTFRGNSKKDSTIGLTRIQQIFDENKKSEDPRFLNNIKMACLRDEWSIYSNSEIQINVSYRDSPKIKLTLGNKLSKDLLKFSFREGATCRLEGETVSAKSYLIHEIEVREEMIEELFIKCELSYSIEASKRNACFFIPMGMTTFGEFSPITEKEFNSNAGLEEFQNCGGFRPLDKKLINNITEIEYYMPNLLIDRDNCKCFGLFISPFNDYTFLKIRQRGELASVSAKTPNWPLIRLLEFIFTL